MYRKGSDELAAARAELVSYGTAGLLLAAGPVDAAWLGIACGSLVATGLGSDAGIEGLGQVLDFLGRAQPAVADRIAAAAAAAGPLIHEGADG